MARIVLAAASTATTAAAATIISLAAAPIWLSQGDARPELDRHWSEMVSPAAVMAESGNDARPELDRHLVGDDLIGGSHNLCKTQI